MTLGSMFKGVIKVSCSVVLCLLFNKSLAQDFNNNSTLTFINHNPPKSPESSSIERYGNIPVSQLTGTPTIEIPFYTVKGSSLNVPISLSYHASGIKVNQEATWAGLGWDIIAGGRITLEIKGGWDKYTKQFIDNADTRSTLAYLTSRYTDGYPSYAYRIDGSDYCGFFYMNPSSQENNYYFPYSYCGTLDIDSIKLSTYFQDLENLLEKGVAEPDIFHVNLQGGISFSFYRDLYTDSIKIKGNENLYQVEEIIHSAYSNSFVITDTRGVKYTFGQEEKTLYNPPLDGFFSSATTAWLLTKVEHLNGDSINLSYTNYGVVLPAPNISESETKKNGDYLPSTNVYEYGNISNAPKISQEPQYLTKIQTKGIDVNFVTGTRKDIGGSGARRLDSIHVISRLDNSRLQYIKFNYDYFTSSGGGFHFDTTLLQIGTPSLENSVLNHLTLRLKLKSIDVIGSDTGTALAHKFFYNETTGLPHKISLDQDHWGYYNGKGNSSAYGSGGISFTPSLSSLLAEGVLSSNLVSGVLANTYYPPPNSANNTSSQPYTPSSVNITNLLSGHANRTADTSYIPLSSAFILDSIVYPTGGSTKFEYEPHRSDYQKKTNGALIGGGLRVKTMKNYSNYNKLADTKKYEYTLSSGSTSGIYTGTLDYLQVRNSREMSEPIIVSWWLGPNEYYDYGTTTFTLYSNGNLSSGPPVMYSLVREILNSEDKAGSSEKYFNVYYPTHDPYQGYYVPTNHMYLEPIQNQYAHGELTSEKYYDNNKVLKKSVDYFYRQIDRTDKFYSIKTSVQYTPYPSFPNLDNEHRYLHFFTPMHSYYQLLDSVVEKNFDGSIPLVNKKSFKYNGYFQPEYEVAVTSKGDESIVYTKTPHSYIDVPQGDADLEDNAMSISYMRFHNIVDVPVEKLIMRRSGTGDTVVLKGGYNIYDPIGNIQKTYLIESASPIPIGQFQRSVYSGWHTGDSIKIDNRYKLDTWVKYGGPVDDYGKGPFWKGPYINELWKAAKPSSFLYDTVNNNIIAVCDGTIHQDIAYTSFEVVNQGGWTYTGSTSSDPSVPTGKKYYNLGQGGGSLSASNLSSGKIYLLSYWTTNGSPYSVTGTVSGSAREGATLQGWTYFEQKITGQTSVSITGAGYIDEVKLHPEISLMKSYTYDNFSRITSETDPTGRILYYEYDASNRLSTIKDQYKAIVKKFEYKLAEQKVIFDGQYYLNHARSQNFTKNNCSAGNPQTITYSVPEGKYKSLTSQADADQQAISDISANGQTFANTNGGCEFYSQLQTVSFVQNNCPSGYVGITVTYTVPAGKYTSLVSQSDANQMAIAELNTISANGQTVANQGTCTELITINCTSSVPEDFSLELTNTATNQVYYFTITTTGAIGQVPSGTYNVRINPVSYSQAYNYLINDTYYQSGEISATFSNIVFNNSNTATIYID